MMTTTVTLLLMSSVVLQGVDGRPVDEGRAASLPVKANVPVHVLQMWQDGAGVRPDVNFNGRLQSVQMPDNTVVFPTFGVVDLNGLQPYRTYTDDATCFRSGRAVDCPSPTTFTGTKKTTAGHDIWILLANDASGNIVYIKALGPDMKSEQLLGIYDTNVLTYLTDDDFDPEWLVRLGSFDGDDIIVGADEATIDGDAEDGMSVRLRHRQRQLHQVVDNDIHRSLRGQIDQQIQRQLQTIEQEHQRGAAHGRQLEQFRVVNLGVVADRTFCTMFGGPTYPLDIAKVETEIMNVVAAVAVEYEQMDVLSCTQCDDPSNALRFTIQISYQELFCEQSYATSTDGFELNNCTSTSSSCGAGIQCFKDFMELRRPRTNASYARNVGHLFQARKFTTTEVGCAYVNVACNNAFGYGVNDFLKVAGSLDTQRLVVAHELGHNLAALHDNNSTLFIMYPSVTTKTLLQSYFGTQSILNFTDVANNKCITTKLPTPAPTPAPTPVPVSPTFSPVPPPTFAPVLPPTVAPVPPPTVAPVPPTTAPVLPTTTPVFPTTAPVPPTAAPVPPTVAPASPTAAPKGKKPK